MHSQSDVRVGSAQETRMDKPPSTPQSPPQSPLLSRRRVFAGAGTAGALAAAAVALPLSQRTPTGAVTAGAAPKDDAQGRYQLTAHVQRYYQTTKV
jgi:hypothetical protein